MGMIPIIVPSQFANLAQTTKASEICQHQQHEWAGAPPSGHRACKLIQRKKVQHHQATKITTLLLEDCYNFSSRSKTIVLGCVIGGCDSGTDFRINRSDIPCKSSGISDTLFYFIIFIILQEHFITCSMIL